MELKTERLLLRPWRESDADVLYKYASDPAVGPICGWPPHTDVENSKEIIRSVLSADETYAVVLLATGEPVGSIGLLRDKRVHSADMEANEGEIGYWISVPYWGQGLIPEAVKELIRRGFEDLQLDAIWCGYYDGNKKSKRVQEKCGFRYHHTEQDKPCPMLDERRTEHFTRIAKHEWIDGKKEMNSLEIALEKPEDYMAVEWLTFAAFKAFSSPHLPPRECPNEHYLAHLIRACSAFIPELDFIGKIGGKIIAGIMYTKSKIIRPDGSETPTITFGPVSVMPELQRQGYGAAIIRHSLETAKELGFGAVVIVGHENYYPRFGLRPASDYGLTMPDGRAFAPFMALELKPGYLGTGGGKWYGDDVFEIDEAAFDAWNKGFDKEGRAPEAMVGKSTTEVFDSMAERYDTAERIEISETIAGEIRSRLTTDKKETAIDYGCGTGLVGLALADSFASVLFVDASEKMIARVSQKIENIPHAAALCADFTKAVPHGLRSDVIIMAQTLLHIKDVSGILSRLYDVLNEGGRLFIVDFDKNETIVSDMVHNGFAQRDLIDRVVAAGFVKAEASAFYRGRGIFMGKDATMFILEAQKQDM